jgi:selenocysteine-specific translation elongation factor
VAEQHSIKFFATSAKTGEGIDDLFNYIVEELPKLERENDNEVIRPDEDSQGAPSKCPC